MKAIAITLARPRLIPTLSATVGILIAAYVGLMITTIVLASLQTHLAQEVQQKQMAIGKLESNYYAQVAQLNAVNPQSLGYVKPTHVTYLTQASLPGLTFAGN